MNILAFDVNLKCALLTQVIRRINNFELDDLHVKKVFLKIILTDNRKVAYNLYYYYDKPYETMNTVAQNVVNILRNECV